MIIGIPHRLLWQGLRFQFSKLLEIAQKLLLELYSHLQNSNLKSNCADCGRRRTNGNPVVWADCISFCASLFQMSEHSSMNVYLKVSSRNNAANSLVNTLRSPVLTFQDESLIIMDETPIIMKQYNCVSYSHYKNKEKTYLCTFQNSLLNAGFSLDNPTWSRHNTIVRDYLSLRYSCHIWY